MLIFREIKPNLIPASSVSLGVFDGVHLGHQKVITDAIEKSRKLDTLSTIITFSNHPQNITAKTPTKLITTLDDRLDLFRSLGIQAVLLLDFTQELSRMTAHDYLKNILIGSLNAKTITIGYDHCFGAQKVGDGDFLEQYSAEYCFGVSIIPPISIQGQITNSSVIRKFIAMGDVHSASNLLGRPFSVKGIVIKGTQKGRELGFPTANLCIPENLITPHTGVYSGFVNIDDNKTYPSVINIGKRPTFGDLKENLIEVHILNFSENLYGKQIRVSFLDRIRDEKKFNSEIELKNQIRQDCESLIIDTLNLAR